MSSYTQILYQVVFASKYRKTFLTSANKDELFGYITGILLNKKCFPYCVGGYSNHIHLIFHLHPTQALAALVRDIKKGTNDWMLKRADYRQFPGWQIGYGAFTYDSKAKKNLVNYVLNQERHHSKKSYKDELVKLLEESEIPFKVEYLFV